MKKLSIFVLSLICIVSHADNLPKLSAGVTLLEHTETKEEKLPEKFVNMPNSSTVNVIAQAMPAQGPSDSNIEADGKVSGDIINTSLQTQIYYEDSYMCIQNTSCTHVRNTYQLIPNAKQRLDANLYTVAYLEIPGVYEDEAILSISGYESKSAKGVNKVHAL